MPQWIIESNCLKIQGLTESRLPRYTINNTLTFLYEELFINLIIINKQTAVHIRKDFEDVFYLVISMKIYM